MRLRFIASMDLAKTPISSFLFRAWTETGMEKSPLPMRPMWAEERSMGMAMLRVVVRESHTPMMAATRPTTIKTMRAVEAFFSASSYLKRILFSL